MVMLIFDRNAIPRTTTRAQWKAIDRWRRMTERRLKDEQQKRIENMLIYGTSHPELLDGFIDRVVNPPVMFYPPK